MQEEWHILPNILNACAPPPLAAPPHPSPAECLFHAEERGEMSGKENFISLILTFCYVCVFFKFCI